MFINLIIINCLKERKMALKWNKLEKKNTENFVNYQNLNYRINKLQNIEINLKTS
jgi:hypothetical protein